MLQKQVDLIQKSKCISLQVILSSRGKKNNKKSNLSHGIVFTSETTHLP